MFQANFWIYPWDLVDEGIDTALDRVQGEAGATGIAVAASYHSIEQLRPHPGVEPRTFRSAAGVQFQPTSALYAGTRVKPIVASWLKKSNPLAAIGEACTKRGMKLRAWTVCCHGSSLAGKYPHAAVKDVFGDTKATWICPVNPDVGEYLRAMVEDLVEHYPFDTIELERPSFDANPHVHTHHKIGHDLGAVGRWLYNICFCESCRQLAKRDAIDVDAAADEVRAAMGKMLETGEPLPVSCEEFLEAHPFTAALVDWRCQRVTALVESLGRACGERARTIVHIAGDRFLGAMDWKAIGSVCDGLLRNVGYPDRQGAFEATVREVYDCTGDLARVELGFNACTPPCLGSEALVSAVSQAARLGVRSVDIYNYGMLPLNRLDWVRQAVRYAQREAG